jgi:hypothetical protein
MTKYLLIIFIVITACSDGMHTLIRDDLFSDKNGNLYLKSVNNEDVENKKDVWLTDVYCDTCWKPAHDGLNGMMKLNNFVDIETFHFDSYLEQEDVMIYADKKYRYRHKRMADGGVISVQAK